MANNCCYSMKIVGHNKQDIDEFISMLQYHHKDGKYFARIFEAYVSNIYEENEDRFVASVDGDCAWSVYSCMCAGPFTYYDRNCEKDNEITNLAIETKRLNLIVEIFSEEPGIGFAEHIIFDNGTEVLMEEEDYGEYYNDENLSIEEFEEENGLHLTEKQKEKLIEEQYVCIGGYDMEFTI